MERRQINNVASHQGIQPISNCRLQKHSKMHAHTGIAHIHSEKLSENLIFKKYIQSLYAQKKKQGNNL